MADASVKSTPPPANTDKNETLLVSYSCFTVTCSGDCCGRSPVAEPLLELMVTMTCSGTVPWGVMMTTALPTPSDTVVSASSMSNMIAAAEE